MTPSAKRRLYEAQGGLCAYCERPMDPPKPGMRDDRATVDHIHPLARGGDQCDRRNLAMACQRCNGDKGNHTPATLRALADRIEFVMAHRTAAHLLGDEHV